MTQTDWKKKWQSLKTCILAFSTRTHLFFLQFLNPSSKQHKKTRTRPRPSYPEHKKNTCTLHVLFYMHVNMRMNVHRIHAHSALRNHVSVLKPYNDEYMYECMYIYIYIYIHIHIQTRARRAYRKVSPSFLATGKGRMVFVGRSQPPNHSMYTSHVYACIRVMRLCVCLYDVYEYFDPLAFSQESVCKEGVYLAFFTHLLYIHLTGKADVNLEWRGQQWRDLAVSGLLSMHAKRL